MATPDIPTTDLTSYEIAATMEADIRTRTADLQEAGIAPWLAIYSDNYVDGTPTQKYVDLKYDKAKSLGIVVSKVIVAPNHFSAMENALVKSAESERVHGMIVQLPLQAAEGLSSQAQKQYRDNVLNQVPASKDVDGLRPDGTSWFYPATPLAVLSILSTADSDYKDRDIVIRGEGPLVGAPLLRMLHEQGARYVNSVDVTTPPDVYRDLYDEADIIITATGSSADFTPDVFQTDTKSKIVIDAGTAEQSGKLVGDVTSELRSWGKERGWRFSANKGGVGPLTVLHLLDHVVTAAESMLVNSASHVPQRPALAAN